MEHEKLEKQQRLKEESENYYKEKATVETGALGPVLSKVGEWRQQIPGQTEIWVQKTVAPGTAKILRRTLKLA